MKCPFCNQDNTRVVDSRPVEDNNAIRRRRQCDECGKRFTTYEKVETIPLIVIKKEMCIRDRSLTACSYWAGILKEEICPSMLRLMLMKTNF